MPETVVLVPFRGDSGWRDKNFGLVMQQVEALGFPVFVGDSGDEPFSIARTWNMLSDEAGDWDRAIHWAADFLLVDPHRSIERALAVDHHYVLAFDSCTSLNGAQTAALHGTDVAAGFEAPPPGRLPFGGVKVIGRAMWDDVGGFDHRFLGWGHEDRAFVHAMEVLHGPRVRTAGGHMVNLWHPKRSQRPRDAYFASRHQNLRLWRQYEAITDPGELRAFLDRR